MYVYIYILICTSNVLVTMIIYYIGLLKHKK